jgi:hypothetical protein
VRSLIACPSPRKGKSTKARKGKNARARKGKNARQSQAATLRSPGKSAVPSGDFNHDWHAATLRLPDKPAVSGGKFNNDWHAATLRLPGKSATCKSSPTPPKAVSSGLLLDKNKCETDFF